MTTPRRLGRGPVDRWPAVRALLLATALAAVAVGALIAMRPAPDGVAVLVARRDVATGERLSPGDVAQVRVPVPARPADALDSVDDLPPTWPSAPIRQGTVLTETNVAGSPESRALGPDEARLVLSVGADQAVGLAAGDAVDLWSTPLLCDAEPCAASLLAASVRITSVQEPEEASWSSSDTARVGVVVRSRDIDAVLGHAATGSLSLVLRAPAAPSPTGAP